MRKQNIGYAGWPPCHELKKVFSVPWSKAKYLKFPKISPGAYILQSPFFGLIFGGAYVRKGLSTEGYLRFKIDWAGLIVGSKFVVFSFVLLCIWGQFSKYKPPGGLYLEARFNGFFFFALPAWALFFGISR